MSNPTDLRRDRDELELEPEKVVDLEVKTDDAEDVRGGTGTGSRDCCHYSCDNSAARL